MRVIRLLAVTVVLFLMPSLCRPQISIGTGLGRGTDARPPAPRLLSPVGETVDLSGKGKLVFKWSPHEGRSIDRDYYDFRLYEGYEMLASTLIEKKKISPGQFSFKMRTGLFKTDTVYTWSVRQVYYHRGKSRRSYNSFRVIR